MGQHDMVSYTPQSASDSIQAMKLLWLVGHLPQTSKQRDCYRKTYTLKQAQRHTELVIEIPGLLSRAPTAASVGDSEKAGELERGSNQSSQLIKDSPKLFMDSVLDPVVVNILINLFSEGIETIHIKYEDNFKLGKIAGQKLVKLHFQTAVNDSDQENTF